jgi:hypothetical protein
MRGSKMVTRVQKQTAWALWLKNLAEMLQPHLTEIKHQEKSNLWHLEPPSPLKTSQHHITMREQEGCCLRQTPTPNLLGRCKPIGEQISSMRYSYSHPWDKPAEHPGQTDPSHRKGSETAQRGIMRRQKRDGNHSPPKIN